MYFPLPLISRSLIFLQFCVRAADVDPDHSDVAIGLSGVTEYTRATMVGPDPLIPYANPRSKPGRTGYHEVHRSKLEHDMTATTGEKPPLRLKDEKQAELEEASDAQLALMRTGRRYEGLEVQVMGSRALKGGNPLKGLRGVVVGDHDSEERVKRLEKMRHHGREPWDDQTGIVVSVMQQGKATADSVPVERLFHLL